MFAIISIHTIIHLHFVDCIYRTKLKPTGIDKNWKIYVESVARYIASYLTPDTINISKFKDNIGYYAVQAKLEVTKTLN